MKKSLFFQVWNRRSNKTDLFLASIQTRIPFGWSCRTTPAGGMSREKKNGFNEQVCLSEAVCESAYSVAQLRVFPPTRLRTCLPTQAHTREITSQELSPPIYRAHSSTARLRPWVCISPEGRPPNNKAHPCLSISQRGEGWVKYAGSLDK